jgi:UDP:flavonoid glycosyltransferase YjiC (YdhE family)
LTQIRQDISASDLEYLICLRGASAGQLAQWQLPHVKTVSTPLKLSKALAQCDAALSYGGMGMTSAILMAGKPSVYVTRDLENYINASLVDRLGAGLHLNRYPGARLPALLALLARVMERPSFKKAAEQFAATHEGHDPAQLSARILDSLSEVLAAPALKKPLRKKSAAEKEVTS